MGKRRIREQSLIGPLMAAPGLIGLLIFIAGPFLLAVGLSFTNLRLGSPLPTKFVGLDQYALVLGDPGFRRAIINNLVFALVVVPTQTALALALALVLNQRLRLMPVFRTFFFMPVVFPMTLVAVVWELIYAPGPDGPLNAALGAVSFGALGPYDYLHNPVLALPAIMLLSMWQGMGFQMVVLLAGLQSIPQTLYEVADINGAGPWQRFRYVTLPQLRNPLIFTGLVTTVLAFRLFAQVDVMTQGGPVNATVTLMYLAVEQAFQRQNIAVASTMTVIFFLIVLVFTVLQRSFAKQEGEV